MRVDVDDDEERYESSVLFRLSNKEDGNVCLRAAYVSFDEFRPDPETLNDMAVFRRCIGLSDFHLIVSAVNAQLRRFKRLSFAFGLFALVATFGAVGLCVVSVPVGVSVQVTVVLLQIASQAVLRRRCERVVNAFLTEHVNSRLRSTRAIYIVFRVSVSGLGQWCEIDFARCSDDSNPLRLPLMPTRDERRECDREEEAAPPAYGDPALEQVTDTRVELMEMSHSLFTEKSLNEKLHR